MAKVLGTSPQKLGRQMTQVFVGGDREPHYVHRDLISSSSDFFKRALCGNFTEKDGVVRLPEQQSTNFAEYIQWLYSQSLDLELKAREVRKQFAKCDPMKGRTTIQHHMQLLELYIMGDALQDEEFQNTCMDAILKMCQLEDDFPAHPGFTQCVFENLPSTSPMRKLVVDFWVWVRNYEWFKDESCTSPYASEFWLEVAKGLTLNHREKSNQKSYPWILNPCLYHIHREEDKKLEST